MINKSVSIVGGGVVSLLTAYYLVKGGYKVQLFEKTSDPRKKKQKGIVLSATFSGEDARIFSLNEARHHNFSRHCSKTKLNTQFRRYFDKGGWMGMPIEDLSGRDKHWIENFELISEERGKAYDQDIISFNKESAPLWEKLKIALPHIFEDGNLVEGLIRLYPSDEAFISGIKQELSIGSIKQILEPNTLKKDYPIYSNAVDEGKIKHALYVCGFSINCQSFCRSLISYLETCEVKFHWKTSIDCIEHSIDGHVSGLISKGKVHRSQHYVISIGFSGYNLLNMFDANRLIAPIYGFGCASQNFQMKNFYLQRYQDLDLLALELQREQILFLDMERMGIQYYLLARDMGIWALETLNRIFFGQTN